MNGYRQFTVSTTAKIEHLYHLIALEALPHEDLIDLFFNTQTYFPEIKKLKPKYAHGFIPAAHKRVIKQPHTDKTVLHHHHSTTFLSTQLQGNANYTNDNDDDASLHTNDDITSSYTHSNIEQLPIQKTDIIRKNQEIKPIMTINDHTGGNEAALVISIVQLEIVSILHQLLPRFYANFPCVFSLSTAAISPLLLNFNICSSHSSTTDTFIRHSLDRHTTIFILTAISYQCTNINTKVINFQSLAITYLPTQYNDLNNNFYNSSTCVIHYQANACREIALINFIISTLYRIEHFINIPFIMRIHLYSLTIKTAFIYYLLPTTSVNHLTQLTQNLYCDNFIQEKYNLILIMSYHQDKNHLHVPKVNDIIFTKEIRNIFHYRVSTWQRTFKLKRFSLSLSTSCIFNCFCALIPTITMLTHLIILQTYALYLTNILSCLFGYVSFIHERITHILTSVYYPVCYDAFISVCLSV